MLVGFNPSVKSYKPNFQKANPDDVMTIIKDDHNTDVWITKVWDNKSPENIKSLQTALKEAQTQGKKFIVFKLKKLVTRWNLAI